MDRQKQVEITDEILAQIERVTKTSLDPNNLVVFEAAALSTNAIHKPGSIYHGARPSRQLLVEAASALNEGTESVPLHTLHMQGEQLPVGRVFRAQVVDEVDGSSTLRAMFYLPRSESELIEKINLSVLDEVSVGIKSKEAVCSKCGFDYFGPEADFTHLFAQTCENGHTIGEDGVHIKLVGLDKWMELSLVSRGASDKPKILSRPKQILSKDEYDRMAASGKPLEALVLFTSTKMENPLMAEENAQAEEEAAAIEAAAAEAAAAEAEAEAAAAEAEAEGGEENEEMTFDAKAAIEALQAQVTDLLAKFAEEPAASTEANENLEASEEEDLQAKLAAAEARIAELEAQTAAPAGEPTPETTLDASGIPVGGKSLSTVLDASQPKTELRAGAFKTSKRR